MNRKGQSTIRKGTVYFAIEVDLDQIETKHSLGNDCLTEISVAQHDKCMRQ